MSEDATADGGEGETGGSRGDATAGDQEDGVADGRASGERESRFPDGGRRSTGSGTGRRSPTPGGDANSRYDRVTRHPTEGPHNSIFHWTSARHPLRVMVNYVVVVVCRVCPSMRAKNWMLRRIGVTVGRGAAWGLESTPDVFWPDLVTVEDHAIVGYDATILCHEFLQDEYRTGEVVVGERAMVGAGAIVLPGVEIGAGAQVAANSLVDDDVPSGATVAGVPATPVDEDERENEPSDASE